MSLNDNDPLKIVYSWIGPRGPIVNTELPNLLSFTAVANGANTTSSRFWSDDIYWRVFMHTGNHPLASTFSIQDNDIFVYPFTLAWRTQFLHYFINDNGILEFSHTPDHIKHQVKDRNGFFLIDYSPEAFVQEQQLQAIHSYFGHYNNIPMGKIIYLTGCMNVEKIYNDWCDRNGIPDTPYHRMIMIPFPISQHAIYLHLRNAEGPVYDETLLPEKLFLVWNRRFRPHRTALALALDKHGLVDRSYFSMHITDPELNSSHFKHTVDIYYNPLLQLNNTDVETFMNKLPLVIDGETDIVKMCADFDRAAKDFYENSLITIVTETNFDSAELTMTEKSWKPAKEKHPFIIVGVSGALAAMHEFGFKTFSEFWDESYDEIEDPRRRLAKIVDVCKEIGSWTNEQILDFKHKVKPILEHNYNILQTNTAQTVTNKLRSEINKRLR